MNYGYFENLKKERKKKKKKRKRIGVGLMALKGGWEEPSLNESVTSCQREQL